MRVYEGSDGRYYTECDLWERFESDTWRPCMWEPETGREFVETDRADLLSLAPVDAVDLPDGVEIRYEGDFATVVDSRDRRPSTGWAFR
ncbi:hypothetical protein [Halegenticoccus tardaugens]|uniref:hypothetical protein n=1 Tax=Halegenticoccus tardaugens TaxID=2071624 RepID=UPI00100A93AB|nr:hypothetical protein [Halegenticoccus tardaugens]